MKQRDDQHNSCMESIPILGDNMFKVGDRVVHVLAREGYPGTVIAIEIEYHVIYNVLWDDMPNDLTLWYRAERLELDVSSVKPKMHLFHPKFRLE